MKKLRILFIVLLSSCVLLPSGASAEERINSYVVHIELQPNGSAFVQEEIVYDLGETPRHGIFRRIPLVYRIPGDRRDRVIEISSIMVTDGLGNLRQTAYDEGGNVLELKIGDPEVTVTGKQLYVIRYTVWGATYELLDKVEFYWNATGNDWPSPIDRARVEVVLPVPVNKDRVTGACYAGYAGRTESCRSASGLPAEGDGTTVTMLRYEHDGLLPHQGITVAVGLPKGTMKAAAVKKEFGSGVVRWWEHSPIGFSLAIPFLVFLAMFRQWWKNGRDPRGRGTVIPEYDVPAGLLPIEAGVLHDDSLSPKAISAEIISLAERGYIRIEQIKKDGLIFDSTDYQLVKLKKAAGTELGLADRFILDDLFRTDRVMLSELKNKLVELKELLEKTLFEELTEKGYFVTNPRGVRRNYMIAGIAVVVISQFLPFLNVSLLASGVIVLIFGWLMPRKTPAGALIKEKLQGFKMYLHVAEKDRINFSQAPEKNPEIFERFLPYAMVFGVEKAWAEQFAELYTEKNANKWYVGSGSFNAPSFAKSMTAFAAATGSAFAAKGGASGGGGFSGGGAGGGGGGSW